MSRLFIIFFLSASLLGDEYGFDMQDIEPKSYEYGGYLRVDNKTQRLREQDEAYQNQLRLEALLDFSYFYDIFTFKTSAIATHEYIHEKISETDSLFNELYVDAKLGINHSFLAGKKSLMWGKGYFFNPVAFLDRKKDPADPTQAREGFILSKYSYNKSFSGSLKNLSLDLVYLRADESINKDYRTLNTDEENSNNIAAKLYLLWHDTDIDLIYNYSDKANDKIGIDFSKNIDVNFEIHGEYAKVLHEGYSYLLGLRYLTDFELTIISEYLYQSQGLTKSEIETSSIIAPFVAKDYVITQVTQKEPFNWLYFYLYYKNMLNLQDRSQQNRVGAGYSFKNNTDIDVSYNINSGGSLSEFGKKQVEDFIWLRVTLNY
jgi:hypothetical protein